MEILRFKIPLKVLLKTPIIERKNKIYKIPLASINLEKLPDLDGQYDWIAAWRNTEFDKKMSGFDCKDVLMEVVYNNGNYIVTLVSDKPFDTIVRNCKYYIEEPKFIRYITLKEAIIDFINGCLSDGIGENEIGYIQYCGEELEVWLGDLIETKN